MHDLDLHGVARMNHRPTTGVHPTTHQGTQQFVAKLAVFPGDAAIWLSAKNRYKIDWGDGTVQNYRSGIVAGHCYNFAELKEVVQPGGYKEITVVIQPQVGYSLTEVNFDPQADDGVSYLCTAQWLSIYGFVSKLNSMILSTGKVKNRHPLLKNYSVRN